MQSKEEQIAKIVHQANKAYCELLGDNSQKDWEEADAWQREAVINGVKFYFESDANPEELHRNWLREKRENGWMYGPVKNSENKTHPCMVPYHELSIEQRVKDHIFKALVEIFKYEKEK